MKNLILVAIAAAVAGFAAAAWLPGDEPAIDGAAPRQVAGGDGSLSLEARVADLEQALTDERAARQLLEDQLIYLMQLADGDIAPNEEIRAADVTDGARAAAAEARASERRRRSDPAERKAARIERLVSGGFDPAQAEWIVRRESELRMEALNERYEAGRSGNMEDYYRGRRRPGEMLRTELGDARYEQYLQANGRPTQIAVSNVIESSPAQNAGLRIGDRIVRYDGSRVFDMNDLIQETMDGIPGENIVVDITRDGQPMQVILPRGPVGITGGPG